MLVALGVERALARAYGAPGQYIEIRTPRGNGYFVLAGQLGEPTWELLVRNAGDAADVLATAPLGTALEVSAPLGDGFPAERGTGRQLVVAVVGSALAVARPLVARRVADGTAARTHVYVGARSGLDVPLPEEVDGWSAGGVEVVLCLSRRELDHDLSRLPRARREVGYVQDVVARDVDGGRLSGALVFAAGPEAMLLAMRGLPGSVLEVVTNV